MERVGKEGYDRRQKTEAQVSEKPPQNDSESLEKAGKKETPCMDPPIRAFAWGILSGCFSGKPYMVWFLPGLCAEMRKGSS